MRGHCPDFDLYRHILVTGSTGSGKTLSVVIPLLSRAIALSAGNPSLKPALVVVDVKGDLTIPVRKLATQNGRTDDLIEFSLETGQSTDLLSIIAHDPYVGGKLIVDANWNRIGKRSIGGDNAYWEIGSVGYISSAFAWLHLLGKPITTSNLSNLLTTDEKYWQFSDGSRFSIPDGRKVVSALIESRSVTQNQLGILLERILQLHLQNDQKTKYNFLSVISQSIEPLAHPISELITSPQPAWTPESWLREGKILLIRLPFVTDPGPCNYQVRLLKLALQRTILSRFNSRMADVKRPCFLFFDEAHRFITSDGESGDQYFIDRCRSMNTGCIYATQSIAALQNIMGSSHIDEFLANLNTRVFGRSLDVPTARVASDLLGDVDLIQDYNGIRMQFYPDPDPDVPPQPTLIRDNPNQSVRIDSSDLANLGIGEFYVVEGGKSYRWEAQLDGILENRDLTVPERPSIVPDWKSIPSLSGLKESVFNTLSPEAETDTVQPVAPDTGSHVPDKDPDEFGKKFTPAPVKRPSWIKGKSTQ